MSGLAGSAIVAMLALATPCVSRAAQAERSVFGNLVDGTVIEAVVLSNQHGMSARMITLGAGIQALAVPDRDGKTGDVVLGLSSAQAYMEDTHYFGATVGRFANRIAKGRFSLDGHDYVLTVNDHENHLHGGRHGFDKAVWSIDAVSSGDPASVVFSYVSKDGEEGYPGELHVTARFSLDERNRLRIEYRATTDKPTVVNLSSHLYFDLSAGQAVGSALAERLRINASRFTPVDAQLIPTGEVREVAGTAFDFRSPAPVGARVRAGADPQIRFGRGYDHNFVLDGPPGLMKVAARIQDPTSGRVMEIATTAPGLQFYSGNFLDATTRGKEERQYREGDALVFEPQLFPDAPNQPGFPSARLDPGQTYQNTIEYRFSTDRRHR